MNNKVIIIGGGISGLSAGCYAKMNDYQTTIFDCNSRPGGLLTTWERTSFNFDGSISFLYGNKPGTSFYKYFKELDIADEKLYVDLDEFNYIFPNNRKSLRITTNLEKLKNDLTELSPLLSSEISDLIDDIRLMASCTLNEDGAPLFDKKFFSFKYLQTAEEYFDGLHDENLKYIFSKIFHSSLPLYLVIWFLGNFINNQLSITKYGSLSISKIIAEKFLNAGGIIKSNQEIKKIIIENNKAIGVVTYNGTTHYADKVICACDYYSVFYDLLEGKYLNKSVINIFENWKVFDGFCLISVGVNKVYTDIPFYNNIILESPVKVLGKNVYEVHLKNFGHLEHFSTEGKSVIQIAFFSDFSKWFELKKDNTRYYEVKRSIAWQFIEEIDKYLEDFKQNVKEVDFSSPYTFWRYSKSYKGSYEGWLPTARTVSRNLPVRISEISSLYLAGQWIKPGGGVGPSLLTGRKAVELICLDDGKHFSGETHI